MEETKLQLQMIWPPERLQTPLTWNLPAGYTLRTYRHGDDEGYINLMRQAGFSTWNADNLTAVLKTSLPQGLFFIIYDRTAQITATTVATHNPSELHPFGGELGWVAVSPAHQGHGLGQIASAAVTNRFMQAGYSEIYLRTDDFRLAAIKTYFKLGWIPLLFAPDMEARWNTVLEQLHMRPISGQTKQ